MFRGKAAYLNRLTAKMKMNSVELKEEMDGSTPPSIFIGRWGYPKVIVGPMLSQQHGDTSILDTPEQWIPSGQNQQSIADFRMQLIRGKSTAGIKDFNNRLVLNLQEIALAKTSVDAEAIFSSKPKGYTFHEEFQPFGPSAQLQKFSTGNIKFEQKLEKVYNDTDQKAADASVELYNKGVAFSQIQKAFSAGTMGMGKNRRLVPTRWSITAVDDILGKHLLESVRQNPVIDRYELYEFSSLSNYFGILLLPTQWRYQWMEAFIHVLGKEELLFGDWEGFGGKKEYAATGGCYYTARFAVAEHLARRQAQSGVIIFRESYPGYIPLGVWNVRENVRHAMNNKTREYFSLRDALQDIQARLKLPMNKWIEAGPLLEEQLRSTPALK